MPTSSSSSSLSSQTSSESSLDYSSSSSSGWCKYPSGYGQYSQNVYNWEINGLSDKVSPNNLFVMLNQFGAELKIEVYSDSGYFNLISSGQGPAGTILLSEINDSNISGSAIWDGAAIPVGSTIVLDCMDLSSLTSLSSSSSLDSTSSSSETSFSTESSSSDCCQYPQYEGDFAYHFAGINGEWTIAGMTDRNSTNCSLFVGLEYSAGFQIVRIYKDADLINLIAIGQASSAGIISFSAVASSGLSGSVYWDGTPVYHPSIIYLSCQDMSSTSSFSSFSSESTSSSSMDSSSSSSIDSSSSSTSISTSSSTSSIDSHSSDSSSSYGNSSSSSTSSESFSSRSTSSTSSSSSIDSHSSSSESIGNTSSSSSSSIEIWNKSKPLILGNTAISGYGVYNQICQTVKVATKTYDIGNVYAFFFGPYGDISTSQIGLSIYLADDSGVPSEHIATQYMSGADIDGDKWYPFTFDMEIAVGENRYLSFVVQMEGMDENNYALWGYSEYSDEEHLAFVDVNGEWQQHPSIIRSIKASGHHELFDTENKQIVSVSNNVVNASALFGGNSASYYQTHLLGSPDRVEIKNPKAIVSFVVDSSGSMGWNDPKESRKAFINEFFEKIQTEYPSEYVFDYIGFGSFTLDPAKFSKSIGQYATINLDFSNPDRTTFAFDLVQTSNIGNGAVYQTPEGSLYTVKIGGSYVNRLYLLGEKSPDSNVGALELVSGIGDTPLEYSSFVASSSTDNIVAYGIKNLEEGHSYIMGALSVDGGVLDIANTKNANLFFPSDEAPSITAGTDGPDETTSVSILATKGTIVRKLLKFEEFKQTGITNDIEKDSNSAFVEDTANIDVDSKYDLVFGDSFSPNHTVTEINDTTNEVTISPEAYYFVPGKDKANSIIQQSMYNYGTKIDGTTLQLSVKDTLAEPTSKITFYLQTADGLSMEWDFRPFTEWVFSPLFWLGETAPLTFEAFDADGEPIPDNTILDILVDKSFSEDNDSSTTGKKVISDAFSGDDILLLENVDNIKKDDRFDIIVDDSRQEVSVYEVNSTQNYIEIYGTLNFNVPTNTEIFPKKITPAARKAIDLTSQAQTTVPLPIANVTQILGGKDLDPSELADYDINLPPANTTYDALHANIEYFKDGTIDSPTVNGIAAIRFLPITEDLFTSNAKKEQIAEKIFKMGYEEKPLSQLPISSTTTPTPAPAPSVESLGDYSVETPVYFFDGLATSSITSYATELSDKEFDGFNLPGGESKATLQTKSYSVQPQISIVNSTGAIVARQVLEPILIDFACPINIFAEFDDNQVDYWLKAGKKGSVLDWAKYSFNGTYASSGASNEITFKITNKLSLLKDGDVNVRIYQNKLIDLEAVATSLVSSAASMVAPPTSIQTKTTINIQPYVVTETANGGLTETEIISDLDIWRSTVINNLTPTKANSGFSWYSNAQEWSLSQEAETNNYTTQPTNGYITVKLPTSNTPSLFMIEVGKEIANSGLEYVFSAIVFNANPIVPEILYPKTATPESGSEKYEMSMAVKWMGGKVFENGQVESEDGVIEDGTVVEFISTSTKIEPVVSQTAGGIASGSTIGPHAPLPCPIPPYKTPQECEQEEEITVVISHSSGYSYSVKRSILWEPISTAPPIDVFFIHADPITPDTVWADGETSVSVSVNLESSTNRFVALDEYGVPIIWVGEYGKTRLLGFEQENGRPSLSVCSDENFVPSIQSFTSPILTWTMKPLNKNVGTEKPTITANLSTNYQYTDKDNILRVKYGVVSTSYPGFSQLTGWVYVAPKVTVLDPLSIEVEIESVDGVFQRDGVTTTTLVATIKWKDQPITSKFTLNAGKPNESIIDYPMPIVTFSCGTCAKENSTKSGDVEIPIDVRGPSTACLKINQHKDVSLANYSVQSGLFRTDIHADENGNEHTHACEVDDNGNGITTDTIILKGDVTPHTHAIADFQADEQGHTHGLRSVAITTITPTNNTQVDAVFNAWTTYDPTNSDPWTGYNAANENPEPYKNRKAFNTVRSSGGQATKKALSLVVSAANNFKDESPPATQDGETTQDTPTFYTSPNINYVSGGFDIKAEVFFKEYIEETENGEFVTVPAEPLPDGTRVVFSVKSFNPPEAKGQDIYTVSYNKKRPYLLLKIDVSVSFEGVFYEESFEVLIVSAMQWLPLHKALVPYPTNDSVYKADAVSKIASLGASQLYDAISLAARRSLDYTALNNISDYRHLILVLTDGDENSSANSLTQATDSVSFVDGNKETPVICLQLGRSNNVDQSILNKIAVDTGGFLTGITNPSGENITKIINEIVLNDSFILNNGTYSDIISFSAATNIKSAFLSNITTPNNTKIRFRTRTSQDAIKWTDWTALTDSSSEIQVNKIAQKYIQFECWLNGDENFVTPSLDIGTIDNYGGQLLAGPVSVGHVDPQTTNVYFSPISVEMRDSEYVSEIHFTHQGHIPETSTVSYGINTNDSLNPEEFANIQRNWIKENESSVILSRANDLLSSSNNIDYVTSSGPWTDGATVEIRRFSIGSPQGEIVNASEYTLSPSTGKVRFFYTQSKEVFFTITILFSSAFRIICKIENFDEEAATIDHIAIMYSVMKRFNADPQGNIIRRPWSKRA